MYKDGLLKGDEVMKVFSGDSNPRLGETGWSDVISSATVADGCTLTLYRDDCTFVFKTALDIKVKSELPGINIFIILNYIRGMAA